MGEVPLSQAAAVGCDPTSSSCTGKWQTWSGLANSLVTPQCPQGRSHSWPQFTLENWKLREQAPTSQPASCGGMGHRSLQATLVIFRPIWPQDHVHQQVHSHGPAPSGWGLLITERWPGESSGHCSLSLQPNSAPVVEPGSAGGDILDLDVTLTL